MNGEIINALHQIGRERSIPFDLLVDAIEAALLSAYKRHFGATADVTVKVDRETGECLVYAKKTAVRSAKDPQTQISLREAKKIIPDVKAGDIVEVEETPQEFGRIAAQTAKQVIAQRLRDAERDIIFQEFSGRQGDIVTGIVQRFEKRTIYLELGKTEAILPPSEQVSREHLRQGQRVKVFLLEVKKTARGPQIVCSRSHPGFVKRLFDLEVPEVQTGIIQIVGIVREPGYRTKIAVKSTQEKVDPVGACVGQRGMRVRAIVDELHGEMIDIIPYSDDPALYVSKALSPAKVAHVTIDQEERTAFVVAPDSQLSLAIGKEGQNAKLAAKLTGWKIDIKSESQTKEESKEVSLETTRSEQGT